MPIRPENRGRYPADWKAIRERILRRALWRCEWPGCKALHLDVGWWRGEKFFPMGRALRDAGAKAGDEIGCFDGTSIRLIKIVLTIAHLDHTPENCAEENLRAWCQRHHLAYDREHHARTRHATRKAAAMTADMFDAAAAARGR